MTINQTQATSPLNADRARIVSRLVDLQARAAEVNTEIEAMKAELRDLPPGDFTIDGRPALRITATRRFDAAKGAGLLSAEQRNAALIVSFDATKVRSHLTGVEIEECMIEAGKPKVSIL